MNKFLQAIGLLTIGLLTVPAIGFLSSFIQAYCLSKMWDWFIFDIVKFHFNIPTLMGICLIAHLLTRHLEHDNSMNNKKDEDLAYRIGLTIGYIFAPFVTLFFGYIIRFWIM